MFYRLLGKKIVPLNDIQNYISGDEWDKIEYQGGVLSISHNFNGFEHFKSLICKTNNDINIQNEEHDVKGMKFVERLIPRDLDIKKNPFKVLTVILATIFAAVLIPIALITMEGVGFGVGALYDFCMAFIESKIDYLLEMLLK